MNPIIRWIWETDTSTLIQETNKWEKRNWKKVEKYVAYHQKKEYL